MAYIQDSTLSFTISLSAYLEGYGTLTYVEVVNVTQGLYYAWNGTWAPYLPQAAEGDTIDIYARVLNEGDTADTLFAEFISSQMTPAEPLLQESGIVPVDAEWDGPYWTGMTMPGANVNVTINAGHVEVLP